MFRSLFWRKEPLINCDLNRLWVIEIEFTGLRPGEKLYEELSHAGENIAPTSHPKIMRFIAPLPELETVLALLDELSAHLHTADAAFLKRQLQRAVPEYRPHLA